MNTFEINEQDLQILSNYNFVENGSNKQNDLLLGLKWVKEGKKWKQQLITVYKQDVHVCPSFLSLFGIGKLKHVTVSLNDIRIYLLRYNWESIKSDINQNVDHPLSKAFKTVCHVANREMRYNDEVRLFKKVSDKITIFEHYWNPVMNGRILRRWQNYQLPNAVGVELRFKDSKKYVSVFQKLTKEDVANIEVGYKYEEDIIFNEKEDPYPPYFAIAYEEPEQPPGPKRRRI